VQNCVSVNVGSRTVSGSVSKLAEICCVVVIVIAAYLELCLCILQAFVESNPSIKWCPYPACGRAVRLPDSDNPMSPLFRTSSGVRSPADTSHAVDCGNGHIFCWFVACHSLLLPECVMLITLLIKGAQKQSCRAFIGLTIHAKIIGGVVPFYLKFWVKLTALERNR